MLAIGATLLGFLGLPHAVGTNFLGQWFGAGTFALLVPVLASIMVLVGDAATTSATRSRCPRPATQAPRAGRQASIAVMQTGVFFGMRAAGRITAPAPMWAPSLSMRVANVDDIGAGAQRRLQRRALAFAREGARVVITGRDQSTLDQAKAQINHLQEQMQQQKALQHKMEQQMQQQSLDRMYQQQRRDNMR